MENLVGEIKMWVGSNAPQNFMFCNGELLNIIDYQQLFDVMGNQFGGDGVENFALPNINDGNISYIICIAGMTY